jgi:hypothetical protein
MRNAYIFILLLLTSSCQVIGDIFQAGMWVGIIGVILIILLVLFIFRKVMGK